MFEIDPHSPEEIVENTKKRTFVYINLSITSKRIEIATKKAIKECLKPIAEKLSL